jgi:hypothetical protein
MSDPSRIYHLVLMEEPVLIVKRFAMVALVVVALTTAACGGGGGGGSTPATPIVTATATPAGTTITSSGSTLTAGGVTGISSSISVAGSGSVNALETSMQPIGLPALQFAARAGSATTQSRKVAAVTNTPLVYVTITAATASSISGETGWNTMFAAAPTGSVYLAYYNGTAWQTLSGPATIAGTTVTFAAGTFSAPIALAANASLFLAVYTGGILGAAASPTPTASASASPSPSPSPTATATASVAPAFVDTACPQTEAAASNTLTSVASTFFATTIPNGKTICLSAWDLSSNVTTALVSAAHSGANVTVITPYSEKSSNSTYLAQIIAAGGHAKTEYTTASGSGTPSPSTAYQLSPMDIHAKFALIDGIAYMDGHNWFSTDVIMQDGYAADFAAIQADLTTFATPAPSGSTTNPTFTTDKQVSLQNESAYLQARINSGIAGTNEYDFVTESFNPNPATGDYNDDVYDGMCQIAALTSHPTMHVLVEEFSGYSSAAQTALQNLMLLDPNATVHTESAGGLEKISMLRSTVGGSAVSAWFGSSNATTTDLFDWGMDINDPGMLSALQTWFDTSYALGGANGTTAIPAAPNGTVAAACGTVHS